MSSPDPSLYISQLVLSENTVQSVNTELVGLPDPTPGDLQDYEEELNAQLMVLNQLTNAPGVPDNVLSALKSSCGDLSAAIQNLKNSNVQGAISSLESYGMNDLPPALQYSTAWSVDNLQSLLDQYNKTPNPSPAALQSALEEFSNVIGQDPAAVNQFFPGASTPDGQTIVNALNQAVTDAGKLPGSEKDLQAQLTTIASFMPPTK